MPFALETYGALSDRSDRFLVECATLASRESAGVECVMLSVTRAHPRTVEHVMPSLARAQPRTIFPSVRLFPRFVKFVSYNSVDSLNFVRT